MTKKRVDDEMDDDVMARIMSRSTLGPTIFWFAIWAICDFNPWVGFGLFFAWGGSVGVFHDGEKRARKNRKDDKRGFSSSQGGESEQSALARQNPELEAPAQPIKPLHRQVVEDAQPARTRLEAAASVADGELGARLRNMVARVKEVVTGLESDPSRLSDVQRLFTYYLPATADLLAARGPLAGSGDIKRLAELDAMIGKLDLAYTDFGERMLGHDARSLEIDMRLLDQALDQEFVQKTKG